MIPVLPKKASDGSTLLRLGAVFRGVDQLNRHQFERELGDGGALEALAVGEDDFHSPREFLAGESAEIRGDAFVFVRQEFGLNELLE